MWCLIAASYASSYAQSSTVPNWYTMMQDPNANYYQTIEAYNAYWKGKKMPPNKEQRLSDEYKQFFATMTPAEREAYEAVFMMNKEFKNWRRMVEPWVQPDGHITSPEEQDAIIEAQRKAQMALEKGQ